MFLAFTEIAIIGNQLEMRLYQSQNTNVYCLFSVKTAQYTKELLRRVTHSLQKIFTGI